MIQVSKESKKVLYEPSFKECSEFMNKIKEARHRKIFKRQREKSERMCQKEKGGHSTYTGCHPNDSTYNDIMITNTYTTTKTTATGTTTHKLVKNLSNTLLSKAQEALLIYGSNFMTVLKHLPHGECITT